MQQDLSELECHIGVRRTVSGDDRYLACFCSPTADPVNLSPRTVGAPKCGKNDLFPLLRTFREVAFMEEEGFTGTSAHQYCRNLQSASLPRCLVLTAQGQVLLIICSGSKESGAR